MRFIIGLGFIVIVVGSFSQYHNGNYGMSDGRHVTSQEPQASYYATNVTTGILPHLSRVIFGNDVQVSMDAIKHAMQEGSTALFEYETLERSLFKRGVVRAKRTACTIFFLQEPDKARNIFHNAIASLETTRSLQRMLYLTPTQAGHGLTKHSISLCEQKPMCDFYAIYRTYDGSCNNLLYPSWGQTYTALQRLLPPNYSDGLHAMRQSVVNSAPLPSTRLVVITAMSDLEVLLKDVTLIFMAWGQMLAHDFAHAPSALYENGATIACCTPEGNFLPQELLHPWCAPIAIPTHDPFYDPLHQKCHNFVRSVLAVRPDCAIGHAEQMNQLTHFLDASSVYGSSETVARSLRTYSGGKLRVSKEGSRSFLPRRPNVQVEHPVCFEAGDSRVQEQFSTSVLNTVLLREHNRIAERLAYLNHHWSDERLYQESRKILIAIVQHITYNEYLPILLGSDYAQEYNLTTYTVGYYTGYSEYLNPTIVNEFGVAAFRMGHSQVHTVIPVLDHYDQPIEELLLRHTYEDSRKLLSPGYLDGAIRGMTATGAGRVDRIFTAEVMNHLFQGVNDTFGGDLISINMQRGRDHGIRSYNDYRTLCGLRRARCFDDLRYEIDPKALEGFKKVYASVDDIDLYAGGVAEVPKKGSLLGPTFHCIVADQFLRLRRGDRYFYDLGGQPHSFTTNQLQEIRKTSIARLFCDNGDELHLMQPQAFKLNTPPNVRIPCDSPLIPQMDLSSWRETY